MENKNSKEKIIPPYISYKTFDNFINSLSQGLPSRIDRSLMGTMSGAVQIQLLSTLQYLGLISENGIPTETLSQLVKSEGEQKKTKLKTLVISAYPFIFQSDFDLANTTYQHLEDQFKNIGPSGETVRKCISFFTAIAEDAGITLSPFLKTKRGRKKNAGVRGRKVGRQLPQGTEQEKPKYDEAEKLSWAQLLLAKFPSFDPAWSDDVKAKWFEAFDKLMKKGEDK